MVLKGSCHCQAVRFSLRSAGPYPFNLCYCSICRKTAGGGGFAINLGGDNASMKIHGEERLGVYQARLGGSDATPELSPAKRHFCRLCASALWVWDPRWPELVHPFASAIDTPLPQPPQRTHIMLASKAPWVDACVRHNDSQFDEYPTESIDQWHERVIQGGTNE